MTRETISNTVTKYLGRAIDTDRYFVVCSNALGGCRGTTGPNFVDQQTGQRYGADFPAVTVADMVDAEVALRQRDPSRVARLQSGDMDDASFKASLREESNQRAGGSETAATGDEKPACDSGDVASTAGEG